MKNGYLLTPDGYQSEELPKRIVSAVPSLTELLFQLGLDEEVIGITRFCIHPDKWFRTKTRVGGSKKLHIDRIKELKPDLILANKEENTKEEIEELSKFFPVYVSEIADVEESLDMILDVGDLTGKEKEAKRIIEDIQSEFQKLKSYDFKPLKTVYFIWKKPWMSIGGDTLISKIMRLGGFENVFGNRDRYPVFELEELKKLNPEVILLSSEPYPFKEKHREELEPHFPDTRFLMVDGEIFCWFGSWLLKTPEYLIELRKKLN